MSLGIDTYISARLAVGVGVGIVHQSSQIVNRIDLRL